MPVYEYVGITKDGKNKKGTVDAESSRVARQRLRSQGIYPSSLKEGKAKQGSRTEDIRNLFGSDRISANNLAVLTRQLATLVGAGIPLVEALNALADQTEIATIKRIIISVREAVEAGSALARALRDYPKAFPDLYVNMVASGEASGSLDTVLLNLADYLETQLKLRRKVTSALFYPALMLLFCILVVIFLLTYVVPTIVEVFTRQGATLPLPTRIMIFISDSLVHYWFVLVFAVVGIIAFFRWYRAQPAGRAHLDKILLRLPVFGGLYRKIGTARVSMTMSALLSSGVGLLEALDIAKNIVANVHMQRLLEEAREGVREGKSLARELGRDNIFPLMLSQMVAIGERSGTLEAMLEKAAQAYENEVDATLTGLTSLIEPLMIIGLGGIVLSIVISILMPMMSLMDLVQG
jgi:general secretion pathway protein F